MKIETHNYELAQKLLPGSGQQIIAQHTEEELVVYQAYRTSIADYAVANQKFGGPDFSYNRMSWIKPNFLWMMYRCGWAEKENQERVLAIWLKKTEFLNILANAAFTSYSPEVHASRQEWEKSLKEKEARLQWDPDHDPFGKKRTRRAIQLGLKGMLLQHYGTTAINLIEDITPFVKAQKSLLDSGRTGELLVPVEKVWKINDPVLEAKTGINHEHNHIIQADRH